MKTFNIVGTWKLIRFENIVNGERTYVPLERIPRDTSPTLQVAWL